MSFVLVLGGTGYIANRLVPSLLEKGYKVKVSYRNKSHLNSYWIHHPNVELVYADTFDKESLFKAFKDCNAIYYLVHSMESAFYKNLGAFEKQSAKNTLEAALANNVQRLIFLGGLSSSNKKFSKHLQSREEVAQMFLDSPLPTTVFKAGIIIGGGSAPFEITRKLLTYYPVILLPKSMKNRTQPIAITNIIYYLVHCLEVPETMNKSFDVGGEKILTFKQILEIISYYLGIKPFLIPAPFLPANFSSFALSLATNVPKPIARSLSSGMVSETICQEHAIRKFLPQKLISIEEEVQKVMSEWKELLVCDILDKPNKRLIWTMKGDYPWTGFLIFRDHRYIVLEGNSTAIWKTITKIGGRRGYFSGHWLWQIRGIINILMGGKGLKEPPKSVMKGEKFDFWTIYRVVPNKELVLWNEMIIPGQATLTYRIQNIGKTKVILHQVVRYYPQGLSGLLNWVLMYGFHQYELPKMVKSISGLSHCKIVQNIRKNPLMTKDGTVIFVNNKKKRVDLKNEKHRK